MNLSEIKARCEAATPGPWEYTDNGFDGYISSENGAFKIGGEPCEGRIENDADTQFIAHARTDLPACVAEIERLQAENDNLRRALEMAIDDLTDASITPCTYCDGNPSNGGNCDMDNDHHEMFNCWKWRGMELKQAQEEK